jgi:ABC-type transporter Mla subunit MlaD
MAKGEQQSELVRAAEGLEVELEHLETMSRGLRKLRLNSEKTIARAAKDLSEILTLPEKLGLGLQALAAAMAEMQARQQAALEPLSAFASELQARMERLNGHMQAFAALGRAAGEITQRLQAANGDRATALIDVRGELGKIADGARALFDAAQADDFPEVAREADTLKQRVLSLRKRLEAGAS